LHEVMLTWNPLSISGDIVPNSIELFPFCPNPTCSAPSVRFSLAEASSVELFIFDVSGRIIESVPFTEYSTGYHSIVISDLSPGIYFCRMLSGDFTETQRFVVIE
ncbi:MAG: T9SS type A sorting domain-containing protein, partial [Deltaproteobacteria bacterium]|nr:T9SS type A sorting domain-containing protein [Deltaproteobacteria bacterium]